MRERVEQDVAQAQPWLGDLAGSGPLVVAGFKNSASCLDCIAFQPVSYFVGLERKEDAFASVLDGREPVSV